MPAMDVGRARRAGRAPMGWVGQWAQPARLAARPNALAAAEALDDPHLVIEALTFLGFDEFLMGRPTRSILERAISLTDAVGPQPVRIDSARRVLGATLMWGGALDEARAELERDHAETVRSGGLTYQWEELVYLAEVELRAGNWDLAARYASEGLESTVETGLEEAREVHLWSTALVAAHRGDIETARANASEGLRIAEAHGDVFHVVTNRSALGFLELSLGTRNACMVGSVRWWSSPTAGACVSPPCSPSCPTRSRPWSSWRSRWGSGLAQPARDARGSPRQRPRSRNRRALPRIARGRLAGSREGPRRDRGSTRVPRSSFRSRSISPAPSSLPGRSSSLEEEGSGARAPRARPRDLRAARSSDLVGRAREALSRVGGRAPSPTELTETERKSLNSSGQERPTPRSQRCYS